MTDNLKDSEPAFPVFPDTDAGRATAFRGMTLRDYFAAKAMQAIIAADTQWSITNSALASMSYDRADAMMEARK